MQRLTGIVLFFMLTCSAIGQVKGPVTALDGDTLHRAWVAPREPVGGELFYSRSTDGGETWESPRGLYVAARFAKLKIDASGGNVFVMARPCAGDPCSPAPYVFVSNDGGVSIALRSFSDLMPWVDTEGATDTLEYIIDLPQTWVVFNGCRPQPEGGCAPDRHSVWVAYSPDSGVTWRIIRASERTGAGSDELASLARVEGGIRVCWGDQDGDFFCTII